MGQLTTNSLSQMTLIHGLGWQIWRRVLRRKWYMHGGKKHCLQDTNQRRQSVAAFHYCKHVTWFSSVTQEAKW